MSSENPKVRDDIKGKRESHLSSPVGNDTEFHLRTAHLSCNPVPGQQYYVCFRVECTSRGQDSGVDMARFVQEGQPDVVEESDIKGYSKSTPEDKMEKRLGSISKKLQEND